MSFGFAEDDIFINKFMIAKSETTGVYTLTEQDWDKYPADGQGDFYEFETKKEMLAFLIKELI